MGVGVWVGGWVSECRRRAPMFYRVREGEWGW